MTNRDAIARIRLTDASYRLRVAMDSRLPKPDQMQLTAPVLVELPGNRVVILPAGFITDCHSVPLWLGSILPEYDNRTNLAAVVHDYLYMHWEDFLEQNELTSWAQYWTPQACRAYADECYRELMSRFHPTGWRNKLYYRAVRLFGWYNWQKFRNAYKQSQLHENPEETRAQRVHREY